MMGRRNLWLLSFVLIFLLGLGLMPTKLVSADKEKRAYLGVSTSEVSRKLRKKYDLKRRQGVQIVWVAEDSPADLVDLERNDIILKVDGDDVRTPRHLSRIIRHHKPGDKLQLEVIHDGKRKTVKVELAEIDREIDKEFEISIGGPKIFAFSLDERPYMGVYLQELNEDLARYFNVGAHEGVLITEVEEDGPAEEAGLKAGDILLKIDEEKVTSPEDAMDILADYEPGDEVTVIVLRGGSEKSFKVELGEAEDSFIRKRIMIRPGRTFFHFNPWFEDGIRRGIELRIHRARKDDMHFFERYRRRLKDWQKNLKEGFEQLKYEMMRFVNGGSNKAKSEADIDCTPAAQPLA